MEHNFEKAFYEKIRKKKWRVFTSITSSVIRSILVLMPILLTRSIYNSLEQGLDTEGVLGVILLTFLIPVIVGISYSYDIRISKYIYIIIKEIRVEALFNVINLKLRKILVLNKGNLFNRIITSLEELGDYYYFFINTTTWYITTSIVGIVIMMMIHFRITLILLIFSLLQVSCSVAKKKKIEKVKEMENQLQAQGSEYIRRITQQNVFIKTALLDRNELENEKAWEEESKRVFHSKVINNQIIAVLSFALALIRTLYLFIAAHYLFVSQSMLKGDFIALNSYIVWLTPVFNGLQECIEDMIVSRENKRRVNEYLEESKNEEEEQRIVPSSCLNQIEISNLSFAYEDASESIFCDISLQVKGGETLFVMGSSGSGKSTLLNIMMGLEPAYKGNILYDGYELRQLSDSWIHQNIRLVGQEVDILPNSLRENILYSGVQISEEKIKEVLHALKLEHLLSMPGGLDWDMRKYPRLLSDGEKKRIAIARALLSKPKVLLLDEPTAGLDNINKLAVTRYIEQSMDGILVIVTHDRIFSDEAKKIILSSETV